MARSDLLQCHDLLLSAEYPYRRIATSCRSGGVGHHKACKKTPPSGGQSAPAVDPVAGDDEVDPVVDQRLEAFLRRVDDRLLMRGEAGVDPHPQTRRRLV